MDTYQPDAIPASLAIVLSGLHEDDASRLLCAFRIAAAAHRGQTRDEGTPFIDHPVAVAEILYSELGCRDVDILIAALNHDVLEDVPSIPADFLSGAIGERATGFVRDVTKEQVPEEEKAERDRRYLEHLWEITIESKLLKLADRIHNLRSIPLSNDWDKARRYLSVSRETFLPLALSVDQKAADEISRACDDIEAMLDARCNRLEEKPL